MSVQQDIVLLNSFLASLSEMGGHKTPHEYLSYANARMIAIGFQVEIPRELDLNADWGDVYLLLDRFKDAHAPEDNQLAAKMGEFFYLNMVWSDQGREMSAQIVPESEIDAEGSEVGDLYGVDDLE